jgi:hypothetical protein
MELARVLLPRRSLLRAAPKEFVLKKPQPLLQELDTVALGLVLRLQVANMRFTITDERFKEFKIIGEKGFSHGKYITTKESALIALSLMIPKIKPILK